MPDDMVNQRKVRVRFAPSPTGSLHLGGARTALYNYLFARGANGGFLLRIEDTDLTRSDPRMTDQILESLKWLGLDWDGEPFFQSARLGRHRDVCHELASKGSAYPCFCTEEELKIKREKAVRETGEYRYDRKCRSIPPAEASRRIDNGERHTFRFKVPEGDTVFDDAVRGRVTVKNREIGDFIILRSDGNPVYQVAVVVDDHDMGITHVIRGDDHLSNTPKQILIYRAMAWTLPEFAHVPMILGADKKRLSKRHGAVSVGAYRDAGYLPEALVNFLALLGWSPGEDREIMSLDEMVSLFTLDRISKNPAVFDETKSIWMNGHYIRHASGERLLEIVGPLLVENGLIDRSGLEKKRDYVIRFLLLLRERMKKTTDFLEHADYFLEDPKVYEETAVRKHWLKEEGFERMQQILQALNEVSDWKASELDSAMRNLAERLEVGAGKVIHPCRVAVTGRGSSPGLFEVMEILGKQAVKNRLERAIRILGKKDAGSSLTSDSPDG